MPEFIQGLDLSRAFYHEAVQPILHQYVPDLTYTAALIGSGSEVLGYDTEMSSDHHWGPRLQLFLSSDDYATLADKISGTLSEHLPYSFRGYSTHFGDPQYGDGEHGTQLLETVTEGRVNHRVEIDTIDNFMQSYLGISFNQSLTPADWLSIPQQKLLSLTAGEVFHDDLGLNVIRQKLAYYPHDVWLYLLACGWSRIGQDEHLAPRAGFVGDELGSALIAGRLVRSIMQLCFLMEKRYAPYPKWFGTAFAQLECGEELVPILRCVQTEASYQQREEALVSAYDILNRLHNTLDITPDINPAVNQFHGRPFKVSGAWRYSGAILETVTDDAVKAIASHTQIGSIDQFSDNTDMRESVGLRQKIVALFDLHVEKVRVSYKFQFRNAQK